jgi:hypothetical protein
MNKPFDEISQLVKIFSLVWIEYYIVANGKWAKKWAKMDKDNLFVT